MLKTKRRNPLLAGAFHATPETVQEMRLAGTTPRTESRLIPRELLEPNPNNPRTNISAESLAEMRAQLKPPGFQEEALLVRVHPTLDGKFQIIAGHRRFFASAPDTDWNGLDVLMCDVREYSDEAAAYLSSVRTNVARDQMTTRDVCAALFRLRNHYGVTNDDLAREFGKKRGWIDNRIKAAKVGEDLQPLLEIEKAMSAVLVADTVKNPHHRARLRRLIEKGATFQEVSAQADAYLGKPKRTAPSRSEELAGIAIARSNGGGYEYSQPNGTSSPLVPLGLPLSHENAPVAPTLADSLTRATGRLIEARGALRDFATRLHGENRDEIESLLAGLQSESDALRADLKAAREALRGA